MTARSLAHVACLTDPCLGGPCQIFTYELASDPRTARRLAGIIPIIGSPHRGFNRPPLDLPMPMFGVWGAKDTTVPPHDSSGRPGGSDRYALDSYTGNSFGWYCESASHLVASHLLPSCPVLSRPVPSCPVLLHPAPSCPVLPRPAPS
jgi:hypothetical protein